MSDYRRWRIAGGTFAFTVVTHDRRPILSTPHAIWSLRESWRIIRRKWPFDVLAFCVLQDHLHTIWQLPRGDDDFSIRWKRIKEEFTRRYLVHQECEGVRRQSQVRRGDRAVWQRRFWERTIRDEEELARCVDYIHFNPVKHGLVHRVKDWKWSSFHRFVRCGDYPLEWGSAGLDCDYEWLE